MIVGSQPATGFVVAFAREAKLMEELHISLMLVSTRSLFAYSSYSSYTCL